MRILRHSSRTWIIVASLALVVTGTWGTAHERGDAKERYLFVWAGDQARTSPDFLAVVDFDPVLCQYSIDGVMPPRGRRT